MKEQAEKANFIRFLNRNYCIASHIAERLDELKGLSLFLNFRNIITATILLLELQLNQTEQLFTLMGNVNSFADSETMIAFLEHIFTTIQLPQTETPFLSLLDYISVADSLMKESAKLAELSLAQLPPINTPEIQLYDEMMLQPLRALLEGSCIVV